MEAAAAFLGVVGFALGSTKTLYATISGIRNGPELVRRTACTLAGMADILQHIQNQGPSLCQDAGIKKRMVEYSSSMDGFKDKLEKVKEVPQDKHFQRFWRSVRTHLKEDDLKCINEIVQWHMTELSVYIGIAERSAVCTVFEEVQFEHRVLRAQKALENVLYL